MLPGAAATHTVEVPVGDTGPSMRLVAISLVSALLIVSGIGHVSAASRTDPPLDMVALAAPGPYATEAREVVVRRPDDQGGTFDARLYIPLPPQDSPGVAASEPAPIVAFGHGYLSEVERYESTLRHLASWGIVVIAPRSAGEPFPSHQAFADDLRTALDWVAAKATAMDGWPGLRVDIEARGLSGHSMGGGAAVLAAADDPSIRAVATLTAAETRPSAIGAARELDVAALFVAASQDAITPPDEHQRPMYEAVRPSRAQLRVIEGGSHCGFYDSRSMLLSLACDDATIDENEQQAVGRALLTAWFRYALLGDERVADVAWPKGPGDGTHVESKGPPADLVCQQADRLGLTMLRGAARAAG